MWDNGKENGNYYIIVGYILGLKSPLSRWNMGVYGDLIIIYPEPYSIYLRGTIGS